MKSQMKHRSMYALLIAAATMIGIAIYGSCSSDDDYPYLYQEGYTSMANSRMTRSGEESNPQDPWPTAKEIKSDPTVIQMMDSLWDKAKEFASENGRKELGFYILYNRSTKKYWHSPVVEGTVVNGNVNGTILRPAYDATYICAWFHTHTTGAYLTNGWMRDVGPSETDKANAKSAGLPYLVYDYDTTNFYDESLVAGEYFETEQAKKAEVIKRSKNQPAHVYTCDPEKRTF